MSTLQRMIEEANKITTLNEFENFCFEYKQYEYQKLDIVIPIIIENLSEIIDIKTNLKEWEKFIGLLYFHIPTSVENAIRKLYQTYNKYPLECLFESIIYYCGTTYTINWFETIMKLYNTFYYKIDKTDFEKHLLFINENIRYYILAYIVKKNNHLNIPENSLYSSINIQELLEHRIYYGSSLTLEEINKIDINYLDNIGYIDYNAFLDEYEYKVETENGYYFLETELLKNAIFETNEFNENKDKIQIYQIDETYSLNDYLLYKWGVVKYMKYVNKYLSQKEKKYFYLYKKFVLDLIPKALENNNLKALSNIKDLIKEFNNSIPENILTKVLINSSFWKKREKFQEIFEEMLKVTKKCFEEYPNKGTYIGDFGSACITFTPKNHFAIWLLLEGYARYEDYNNRIVIDDSVLGAYEFGNVSRSSESLQCASEILNKYNIKHNKMKYID